MTTLPPNAAMPADVPEFVEPPKWPKVIGIISVVWGVLGVGCIGCGVVGVLMPMMMTDMMQQQFPDGLPPVMTQGPSPLLVGLFVLSFITALVLIAAGAVLLARKYSARWLHLVWAVVTIVSSFASTGVQVKQQQEMRQWVRDNPNTKFAQQQSQFGTLGETIGVVVGVVLGLGYPVFCCVWFGFVKKDPEEYSRGVEQLM